MTVNWTLEREDEKEPDFEPVEEMDDVELRSMVLGYVSAADRQKLIELLTVCRDLYFDHEV